MSVNLSTAPATPRQGWSLGSPPSEGAVPCYYLDGNEIWLGWYDGVTGEPADPHDIEWPFVETTAQVSDLDRLGFKDVEDLPSP